MEITWYGLSCFRITERGYATVVTDPYSAKVGLTPAKLKSDVVTSSHDAIGHNNISGVSGQSQTLTGPGEYEIGGVFITGIATPGNGRNIIYVFDYDSLSVAHMGDLTKMPTQAQIEALGEVNVLLLPVGGGTSLNAVSAAELVSMIEPNIIVPMHYSLPGLKVELEPRDRFLKEMGLEDSEEESSLKISASGLPEEPQVVILSKKD